MILKTLTVNNFRCFYGNKKIQFATDPSRNVTLIHAENGFGKTTLLNAFKWVLYGDFSEDVERKEQVINHRAEVEDKSASAMVELEFEHNTIDYRVRREQFKGAPGPDLKMFKVNPDTKRQENVNNPRETILSILPEGMDSYFFFNGERIDYLSRESAKGEISKAIKTILGMELIGRSIDELKGTKNHFLKEFKTYGSDESKKLAAELEGIEDKIEEEHAKIATANANVKAALVEISDIEKELKKNSETRDLQNKRESLNAELDTVIEHKRELIRQKRSFISKQGYWFFMGKLKVASAEVLDEKRSKRILPALYKDTFITDILEEKRCICGAELEADTAAYKCVESMLQTSGNDALEQHYHNCRVLNDKYDQAFEDVQDGFKKILSQQAKHENKSKELNDKISEIASQISDSGLESANRLEQKRDQLQQDIGGNQNDIRTCEVELECLTERKNNLERELDKTKGMEVRANKAQASRKLTEEVMDYLISYQEELIKHVHSELQTNIDTAFRSMCNKDYKIELTPDFNLKVLGKKSARDKEYVEVPKSTGENQITSLSFIGGLVKLAGSDDRNKVPIAVGGGHYPIVMDSPFGSLDNDYREGIAEWVPTVAKQVVIFVSSSQYENQVEKKLKNRIGQEYLLQFHSPGLKDKTPTKIEINGKEYTQFIKTEEYSYTDLIRM